MNDERKGMGQTAQKNTDVRTASVSVERTISSNIERTTSSSVEQSVSVNAAQTAPARTTRTALFLAAATLALAGALGLAACAAPATSDSMGGTSSANTQASDAYHKITADEAQTMMDAGSPTIVDVRTPQEYEEGHIPGAINIPVESIGAEKPAELTDTNAELIVYCRTGVRSKQASDKLVGLGYQNVNDMGGIVDWHGETVSGTEPGGN